jgi:vacuolar-type H+-ATPase subunit D/Vma8
MAKLKKTKNELKAQREALQRYGRFLPTLELKKQQLQREVRRHGNGRRGILKHQHRLENRVPSQSLSIHQLLVFQNCYN